MRICLMILPALFACAALAETPAEIFSNGLRYYVRGDYSAAREMFAQTAPSGGEIGAQSKFYLASIAAYNGENSAYGLFSDALKNPPKDMANKIAASFANFAIANGKPEKCLPALSALCESGASDSLVDWYCALALSLAGDEKKARALWEKSLEKYFPDASAVGADMFVLSYIEGDKFAKSFAVSAAQTDAAIARAEAMEGKKISRGQGGISLLCQIILAESGGETDAKVLADTVYKFRDAPFAWRGSLALSKMSFAAGKYAEAETFARDAALLSPPESEPRRRCVSALADALRLEKKYSDAIFEYQKVYMARRAGGELSAAAIYKTGLCYYEQGDWANAHACFERVYVMYFKFEYWGSRAYYYAARALYSLGQRRDANATLLEYFKRAKDRSSEIYLQAKEFYDKI